MTSFIANIVRNEDKRPEPYEYKDFLIDWVGLWESIGTEEILEPPEEDVQALNQALLGKVIDINTWFGGTNKGTE
jgi:hypothetical protein